LIILVVTAKEKALHPPDTDILSLDDQDKYAEFKSPLGVPIAIGMGVEKEGGLRFISFSVMGCA